MSEITLHKAHDLGLEKVRALTRGWVETDAPKLGLSVRVEPGQEADTVHFERSGVSGAMVVSGTRFDLSLKLGMMMAAFKPLVEAEIGRQLDRAIERAGGARPA